MFRKTVRRAARLYALNSAIPGTFTALAAYHAVRGEPERARGYRLFAVTGWLCIPMFVPLVTCGIVDVHNPNTPIRDFFVSRWARATWFFSGLSAPQFTYENEFLLNETTPCLIVSNHESWLDVYALYHIATPTLKFVSKREIFFIPVIGWSMYLCNHVGFSRSSAEERSAAVDKCVGFFSSGGTRLAMFPEGTRADESGKMGPLKIGAFIVAVRAQVPIVPVSLSGTGIAMPKREPLSYLNTQVCVRGVVHAPIYPDDTILDEYERALDLRARVGEALSRPPLTSR